MFFFFESDEEKKVRQQIQKNMDICLSNPKRYSQAKDILARHVSSSNQKAIQKIVDTIKATIKNEDLQPVRKYQAILLLRDIMRTFNKALGKYVVKKILKRLTILAQHKTGTRQEGDEERGRDIFGKVKRDQEAYSIKFLTTLLTGLEQWGTNWPKTPDGPFPDFHRQYNELVINGVNFPKQRPKQPSLSPPPSRSISPAPMRASVDKPPSNSSIVKQVVPKQQAPVKQIKKKLNPKLQKQLSEFYEKSIESVGFFYEMLQNGSLQDFPLLKDIVAEVEKNSDKGSQLVIKLQSEDNGSRETVKIQSLFTFLQKIQKDLNIVSKKPAKYDVFKKKYLELSKNVLDLMNSKETPLNVIKQEPKTETNKKPKDVPSINMMKNQSISPPKQEQRKEEGPKIKNNQNRYISVPGLQVLDKFSPNSAQFNSGGQNGNTERFGSFGGNNTDRHRASLPISSPNDQNKQKKNRIDNCQKNESPAIQKQKQPANNKDPQGIKKIVPFNSEKQGSHGEVSQSFTKKIQINKDNNQQKNGGSFESKINQRKSRQQVIDKSDQFFKKISNQIPKVPPPPKQKEIVNPFKDNDSFGAFGQNFSKHSNSQGQDFFQKLQNQKEAGKNDLNKVIKRRKNPVKEHVQQDPFNPNIKSQISEGLSAFSLPKGQNSQLGGNKPEKKTINQPASKNSIQADNPFGESNSKDKISEQNKSFNFINQFQNKINQNPFSKQNLFQRSGVIEPDTQSVNRGSKGENPFQTGNFGKLPKNTNNKIKQPVEFQPENRIKSEQSVPNPFQTDSVVSKSVKYGSIANPFQSQVETVNSRKIRANKQKQVPHSNKLKDSVNPFEQQKNVSQNPFESETVMSGKSKNGLDFLQIFKPPSKNQVKNLSERDSFKNIKGQNQAIKAEGGSFGNRISIEPIRQSFFLQPKLEKQPQHGINFSQFMDVANSRQKISDEKKVKQNKSQRASNEHEKSGFSLSNFAPFGDPYQPQIQASNLKNSKDFFEAFAHKVPQSNQKSFEVKQRITQTQQMFQSTQNFFEQLNNNKPEFNIQKVENNLNNSRNVIARQKTVHSNSQKSFDFSPLQKLSGIQKINQNKKQVQFQDFGEWSKNQTQSKKIVKEPIIIDNVSQKSLSWGDFDKEASKLQPIKAQQIQAFKSNVLKVQSRKDIFQNQNFNLSQKELNNKLNKMNQQSSNSLKISDFAPISKKGKQWNPLSHIPHLKSANYMYMIDQKKLAVKKNELQECKRQYNQKLEIFKYVKQKNDVIRIRLMQKMNIVEEVINQKGQFIQILKNLKESNQIKEKQILDVNKRIKTVEEIRAKILHKEKLLFQITKNQINLQERRVPMQRSTANKWQMFNKNLEIFRNNAITMTSRYSYQ